MAEEDEAKLLQDAKRLPFEDRLTHKHWKVRSEAYADVTKEAQWAENASSGVLKDFGSLAHKCTADSNANALDGALDALVAFLGKADEDYAQRAAASVCGNLVSKGLTARTKTAQRSSDALMLFVELDSAEAVVEALLKGLANKIPKAVAASADVLLQVISAFGVRVIKPSPVLKAVGPLFDHKDSGVRDKAKDIAVELTRWMGPAAVKRDLTDKMRDAQKKEVEESLEGIESGRMVPTRFLRKEAARQKELLAAAAAASQGADAPAAASTSAPAVAGAVDAYEFCDPEDILPRLSKKDGEKPAFWDGAVSSAWKERHAAFNDLKEWASTPRIAPGDFGEVARIIRKTLLKDSNVAVITEAVMAAANLAKGLRKDFRGDAKMLVPALLDKLKDKTTNLVRQITVTLSALNSHCLSIADMSDDLIAAFAHKVPKVQTESLEWTAGAVAALDKPSAAKLHKEFVPEMLKLSEAADPAVRNAALSVLAAFCKAGGGYGAIGAHFTLLDDVCRLVDEKLDAAKKKKLEELIGSASGAAPATAASAAQPPSSAAAPAPLVESAALKARDTNAPPPRAAASIKAAPKLAASSKSLGGAAKAAKKDAAPADEPVDVGTRSPEEVAEACRALFGAEVVNNLGLADWKERLAAVSAMASALPGLKENLPGGAESIVRQLGNKPGWDEKNFQVLAKAFDVVLQLARADVGVGKREAALCIGGAADKLADTKLKGPATELLTGLSEATGPRFVISQLWRHVASHKNPKVTEGALVWVAEAVAEFTVGSLDVQGLIKMSKECLASTNPGVKGAAIKLLGVLHTFLGPGVKDFLGDVKPALMASVDAEFARCPYSSEAACAAPKRAVKGAAAAAAPAGAGAGGLPREDISGKVSSALIKELGSANWKARQAALEAVDALLGEANRRIGPSVGPDLVPALKARLTDSNKMLVIMALSTIGGVAEAMGAPADRALRPILADVVRCFGDQKKQVREAAGKALDSFAAAVSLDKAVPTVAAAVGDAKFPTDGRRDMIAWIAERAAKAPEGSWDIAPGLAAAAAGLADKSKEVREAGAALLQELAARSGEEAVQRAVKGLPKAAQATVLEKLPAAAAAGPASAGAAAPAAEGDVPVPAALAAASGTRASVKGAADPLRSSKAGALLPPKAAASTGAAAAAGTSGERPASGPALLPNDRKEERLSKVLRKAPGQIEERREGAEEELEAAFAPFCREDLAARLFSRDFKLHVEACDLLTESLASQLPDVIGSLDLVFRWVVLRLTELAPNTSSLLKVLDFVLELFAALKGASYRMREEESSLFLSVVVEKSGHNLPAVRDRFRRIMRAMCGVYPVSKVVGFLAAGLASKNTRSRAECLEELGSVIERHGLEVCERGTRVLPSIVPLCAERDPALRKSALDTLGTAYKVAGEGIWKSLGKITTPQRSSLEEKFRKVQKELAASGKAAPGADAPVVGARPATAAANPLAKSATFQRSASAGVGAGAAAARAGLSQSVSLPRGALAGTPERAAAAPPEGLLSTALSLPGGATPAVGLARTASLALSSVGSPDARAPQAGLDDALRRDWSAAMLAIDGADEPAAVEGMKMACNLLKDCAADLYSEAVVAMLAADAEKLVAALSCKVQEFFERAAAMPQPAPSRSCKYVLNTIMQTFQILRLSRAVSEPTLRRCIGELLLRLLDDKVPQMEEGGQVVKALNVLMLKVLENANRTGAFTALLLLLRLPPQQVAQGPAERRAKFSDLVVKCLIKLTRTLGASLAGLDVAEVLLTIHGYFMTLTVEEIKRRGLEDDRPLRMVKTVLYELTKVLGPGIKEHCTKVPPPTFHPRPIIYAYIELNLQSLEASGALPPSSASAAAAGGSVSILAAGDVPRPMTPPATPNGGLSTPEPAQARPQTAPAPPPPTTSGKAPKTPGGGASSHDVKARLAAIFKKIGDKATTQQGIEELYHFKNEHPEVDITPHLGKTSEAFQLYIQRGLAKVDAAQRGGQAVPPSPMPPPAPESHASGKEAYQERLNRIKTAQQVAASIAAGGGAQAAAPAAAAATASSAAARQNLDALRERMRSIAARANGGGEPAASGAAPAAPAAAEAPAPSGAETAAAPARAAEADEATSATPMEVDDEVSREDATASAVTAPPPPAEPAAAAPAAAAVAEVKQQDAPAAAAAAKPASVSLGDLQARMARIRAMSGDQTAK